MLGELVWKSRQNKDNRNKSGISEDHEYVLVVGTELKGERRKVEGWSNEDDDPRGEWESGNMVGMASKEDRPNLHYDLVNPLTGVNYGCPTRGWRYEPATMAKLVADNRILWPSTPSGRPREKVFREELGEFTNASSVIDLEVHTRDGTLEYEEIFGDRRFPFPKPSALIEYLIGLSGIDDALVLDSFAGSGTTAQAVMSLNKRDGGMRRFVLVETESYADQVTAERIRRVSAGIGSSRREELRTGLGGSFTFCDLGEPLDLERFFSGDTSPAWDQVARYIVYTATGATLPKVPKKPPEDWFVGEAGGYRIHLLYKPDLAFMRGTDAAVSAELAARIAKANILRKPVLLYAAARFVSQKELSKQGITFCQLPYAIHRLLGDGPTGSAGNAP